jgi:hypothetical protein
MQVILPLIEAFIQAEHEALIAQYSERDAALFQDKRAKVEKFFANGIEPEIRRPAAPDETWFAAGKRMLELKSLAPRVVFQIKLYRHPRYPRLYRAYLSSTAPARGKRLMYFKNYFVAEQDGDLKIISHYDYDLITDQEGERLVDGGLSWIWNDGQVLDTLGDFEKSWKFQAPDDPAQRAEYEAE